MTRFQDATFRSITPADLSLINQLMREGKGYWGYDKTGMDRFMHTFGIKYESYFQKTFGYIAESCQETIGYYLFKIHEEGLELDHFFLDTQFIGQGYGRHLWEHCVKTARKKGWADFSFSSDLNSHSFYERMGAVKIDERPSIVLPGHKVPIMRFVIEERAR